jgi:hypothetical protein
MLTGGCNCGGVRFELTEEPSSAGWCHCTRCQRRTGTGGSIQTGMDASAVRVLQGEELLCAWEPPDGFAKVFCSACGSSMWSRSPDGKVLAIRLGVFDSDPGVRPGYHQFTAYLAPWDTLPDDGLPRYPEGRPSTV